MVENKLEYGVFDNKEVKWLWKGTEQELLTTLKEENISKESFTDTTFKGHRLFDKVDDSEKYSYIRVLRSRLLFAEYKSLSSAVKPFSFYIIEGQKLTNVDEFNLLAKAGFKKAIPYKTSMSRGLNFRNGPIPDVSKTYRFSNYYRSPNTAGIRKELSRFNVDKEYIKGLVKSRTYIDAWDDNPRTLTRSWKDKKIRHQWQKHKK